MTDLQQRHEPARRPTRAGAADRRPPPSRRRGAGERRPASLILVGAGRPARHPRLVVGPRASSLGFLVMLFLHELGHYLTARRAGMKVTEFFLGFGPRIWSFRRGEIEYGLKAIPLGAYVRIIGMNNLEEVDPADEPRTYRQKGYWSRFCVAVAGVAMHFLWRSCCCSSPSSASGCRPSRPGRSPRSRPTARPRRAAIVPGDQITAIDGQPVATLTSSPPSSAAARARRSPSPSSVATRSCTKQVTLAANRPDSTDRVGFLGIGPAFGDEQDARWLAGVQQSFAEFGRIGWQSVVGLGQVFSPSGVRGYVDLLTNNPAADPNQRLLSPVGAVKVGTEVARQDFGSLLLLLAVINILIGLFNLIPLLPFDGGHIVIATYEAVRSRKGKPYCADITKLLPVSYGVLAVVACSSSATSTWTSCGCRPCSSAARPARSRSARCRSAATHRQRPVDDHHQDGRRRGHPPADLRPRRRRLRHRPLHVQRDRGGRGPGPDRAPLAAAGRRRHPLPVQAGPGRARSRRPPAAPQPGQHPQARAQIRS